MNKIYADTQTIKEKFKFLLNLGFNITREENLSYGSYVEFKGNGLKIYLGFEFKSYTFDFLIYLNEDIKYSDNSYREEIISFCLLAKKYDNSYNCTNLQPKKKNGYSTALEMNVNLLKTYIEKLITNRMYNFRVHNN